MIKIQTLATASVMTAAFAMAPAFAGGSIGGDCCADLEERVAELEATTVRKGNRKVSLKLSGHVNKALLFGDALDFLGLNDPLIDDNNLSQSRFRLTGKAKITSDLYAGYAIELGLAEGNTKIDNSDSNQIFTELRKNELYIGSKTLGRLTIGKGSTASDGTAEVDLSGTAYLGGGTLSWAAINGASPFFNNLDGFSRKERVRYDSPSLAGFKVSASWQENDDTDVAVRFAGAFGDFKLAAAVGFWNDDSADATGVSGSVSAMHTPTGINLTFAAADDDIDTDYVYYQVGIKQKVFAAGATALSVGYYDGEEDGVENTRLGVTLVQKIDAAATELYASYQTHDIDNVTDDLDLLMVGARIKF